MSIICEGALSGMPAVRAFALYAGMALLIDFVMQVIMILTNFLAALQNQIPGHLLCCLDVPGYGASKEQ